MKNKQSNRVVYVTKDYDMFKIPEGQRPLKKSKIKALLEKVKKKNLLIDRPILVTPDYEIIDGQTRHAVAKILESELPYIISESSTGKDMGLLNSGQVNWSPDDYLNFYVSCHNNKDDKEEFPNYIALHRFLSIYPFFMTFSIAKVMSGTSVSYTHLTLPTKRIV